MPESAAVPQLLLMRHAAAALAAGRHALLESPTGTGKTLALLATVLATQWYRKQAAAALGHPYHQRMIYVSRTHAQLDQVTVTRHRHFCCTHLSLSSLGAESAQVPVVQVTATAHPVTR